MRKLLPLCIVFTIILFIGCKYDTYSLDDSPDTGLARVVVETEEALLTKIDYIDASAGFFAKDALTTNVFNNGTELASGFDIRLRGNTTNTGTKRPYNLKIPKAVRQKASKVFSDLTFTNYEDNNTDKKVKRVALLANALEASMMRNDICFAMMGNNLGADTPPLNFQWTVNHEFVDLFINDEYKGTYLMTDATNGITQYLNFNEGEGIGESGFFLSIDSHYDEDPKFRTDKYNLPVMPKWPEYDDYEAEKDNNRTIENGFYTTDLERFKVALDGKETILATKDWDDIVEAFDIDSFAKFWLIVNIAGTSDPGNPSSVYFYQLTKDGKLYCGPGWDFDMFTFLTPSSGLYLVNDWYYKTFMECEGFRKVLKNYWFQLRNFGTIKYRYGTSDYKDQTSAYDVSEARNFVDDVANYIDDKKEEIRKSWNANGKLYDNRITALNGQFQTIDGHAYALEQFLYDRAEVLDTLIGNL